MVKAIAKELELQKGFLNGKMLKSIYFGGGTPSLLDESDLDILFNAIHKNFTVSSSAEITLEANPDDLDKSKIEQLSNGPVNRLSIGVQSFRDADLQLMNRSHDSNQAISSIKMAQSKGMNLTIDLIYAQPGMSNEVWADQVQKAIDLKVPHISSYALTVEPKTVLAHQIETGKVQEVEDSIAAEQFDILIKLLADKGYEHYEVSNFAMPGNRAVHNSSYWKGEAYLGLGPSAHSYKPGYRHWNISNNALYLKALSNHELNFESEELSAENQYNEWLMISLRTMEGLDLSQFKDRFLAFKEHFEMESKPLIEKSKLQRNGERLFIPPNWRFHSDGIAAALFYI